MKIGRLTSIEINSEMSDINENTKLIPADITMDEGDGVAPARSYGSGNDTGTFQQGKQYVFKTFW